MTDSRSLAPVLMVQGTASSVGKSIIAAGLCRLFARRGLRVAPFKAQNMSNNAAVCPGGGEIGRAQFSQAVAARVEPTVDMNPILLKPQSGASQVVVRGIARGSISAREYLARDRDALWSVVTDSLDHLRSAFDVVVAEGAGSPAEINLRDRDIVNMRVALHAGADVLLVGDIDRGGVFASLLGTWEWLSLPERAVVRGFVLNKFRGDASLLSPAPELLRQRTGVSVMGVVPYLEDLRLPEEDAASLVQHNANDDPLVDVAIIRLPHVSNFDEFGPLAAEPGVQVRYVSRPAELRAPDLLIVPGSKATIPDLLWLVEAGLADRIRWLATHATPILGICGGYQMLGRAVHDPAGLESDQRTARGLDLLPVETELAQTKRLVRTNGRLLGPGIGVWRSLAGLRVQGYEIHMGRTRADTGASPFLELRDGFEGTASSELALVGTSMHGLLEQPEPRHALLRSLADARGFTWDGGLNAAPDPYDVVADALASTLRVDGLRVGSLLGGVAR